MKNNAVLGYIPRTIKGYIAPIQKKSYTLTTTGQPKTHCTTEYMVIMEYEELDEEIV